VNRHDHTDERLAPETADFHLEICWGTVRRLLLRPAGISFVSAGRTDSQKERMERGSQQRLTQRCPPAKNRRREGLESAEDKLDTADTPTRMPSFLVYSGDPARKFERLLFDSSIQMLQCLYNLEQFLCKLIRLCRPQARLQALKRL
jgi:hypothetical protein